jgi:hypothetical protein
MTVERAVSTSSYVGQRLDKLPRRQPEEVGCWEKGRAADRIVELEIRQEQHRHQ